MSLWRVERYGSKDSCVMYVRDENKVKLYEMLNTKNTFSHYAIEKVEA